MKGTKAITALIFNFTPSLYKCRKGQFKMDNLLSMPFCPLRILLVFMILLSFSFSQNPEWVNFIAGNYVMAIALEGIMFGSGHGEEGL